jgi:AraC-like DNA-binding protein
MHGVTNEYSLDPIAEYVFGVILHGAMVGRRGRKRYVFGRGDIAVWDPSGRHSGTPHLTGRWEARLVILQLPIVAELIQDPDAPHLPVAFDSPLLHNPALAQRFVALHRALEEPASILRQSDLLHEWIRQLCGGRDPSISARRARQDQGLRRACELLRDDPARECTLDELARAARSSRHRLSRLFRAAYGCAPHQFLLAQRLRLARSALDAGASIAEAAQRSGFTDQSHLHRHFKRALGLTPREYQLGLRSNVQDPHLGTP